MRGLAAPFRWVSRPRLRTTFVAHGLEDAVDDFALADVRDGPQAVAAVRAVERIEAIGAVLVGLSAVRIGSITKSCERAL